MREDLPRAIDDDLTLRRATPADRDRLLAFTQAIHEAEGAVEIGYLLEGNSPDFRVEDVLVVVDRDEQVVSSLCLIPIQWQIGQSTVHLGQVEFVGTLLDYRGRGLIRAQMAIVDRWMAERQIAFGYIGGIPYFYRLFGYEYAVDISPVGALTVADHAGKVRRPEGVVVRPAVERDVPAIMHLDRQSCASADIRQPLAERALRWLVSQRPAGYEVEVWAAERGDELLGSVMYYSRPGEEALFYFTGGDAAATAFIAAALAQPNIPKIVIDEPADTPVGRLAAGLAPKRAAAEALYLRVNNPLLAFRALAGELERRIAASEFAGLSRTIDLGLYRFGVQLEFEHGRIDRIESLPGDQDPKIGIPPDVLPKLLFGYRDIDQIGALYPDLRAPEDWELLRVLFPPLRACIRWFL